MWQHFKTSNGISASVESRIIAPKYVWAWFATWFISTMSYAWLFGTLWALIPSTLIGVATGVIGQTIYRLYAALSESNEMTSSLLFMQFIKPMMEREQSGDQ